MVRRRATTRVRDAEGRTALSWGRLRARPIFALALAIFGLGTALGVHAQTAVFMGAQQTVATVAGGNPILGVAVDAQGNLWVTTSASSGVLEIEAVNGVIPASPTVVTIAAGSFLNPAGLAFDSAGNLWVADPGDGAIKEIVATGGTIPSIPPVNAIVSGFGTPWGLAFDSAGDLWIADYGNDAVEEIVAVNGSIPASPSVTTVSSDFDGPKGVWVDSYGNVFVADTDGGNVDEMAGIAPPAASAPPASNNIVITRLANIFSRPSSVSVDNSGNVWVADSNNRLLREIVAENGSIPTSPAILSVAAGSTGFGPAAVTVDARNNVYYAAGQGSIYQLQLAPNLGQVYVGQGASPALLPTSASASLLFGFAAATTIDAPAALTQGAGYLDFTDAGTGSCDTNGTSYSYQAGDTCTVVVDFHPRAPGLRMGAVNLTSGGSILGTALLSGIGVGPITTFSLNIFDTSQVTSIVSGSSAISGPSGVTVDAFENVYYTQGNAVYKMAWNASNWNPPVSIGSSFGFSSNLWGVGVDGAGNVFVADYGNSEIVEIPWTGHAYGVPFPVYVIADGEYPSYLAFDGAGNLYWISTVGYGVQELPRNGTAFAALATSVPFSGNVLTYGLAVDAAGDVYASDQVHGTILEVPRTLNGWGPEITVASGLSGGGNSIGQGLAVDAAGDVFAAVISPRNNGTVVEFPWNGASWNGLTSVFPVISPLSTNDFALDSRGNIFLADANNAVRLLDWVDPPSLAFAETAVGSTSIDSPQNVSLSNIGNAPLLLAGGDNPSYPTDFPERTSTPELCTPGESLSLGAVCNISVTFTPTTSQLPAENVAVASNNLYLSTGFLTQFIGVTGTASGGAATPTINWAPGTVLTYGNALGSGDFSAVAMAGTTNISADGTFAYNVGSVGGTTATPSTILPGGSNSLCAQWTPLSSYASQYNAVSLCVPITVNAASTSINWTPVSPIVSPATLGSAQFNAAAISGGTDVSADGTFAYYVGSLSGAVATTSTVLPVGSNQLCTQWTPSSPYIADYNSASLCVSISVTASTSGNPLEWTWMGGSTTQDQAGIYGSLGADSSSYTPGARYGSSSWTDQSGNLWLFGGFGADSAGIDGYLNDLWEFNPSLGDTGEWAWIGGADTDSQTGIYGTLGTPASGNVPGARLYACSWTDRSGNFWLFGGAGYDSAGNSGYLNDLWKFSPSLGTTGEWTWVGGSNVVNQPTVYGTPGSPAAANVPGARYSANCWTDSSGDVWLFGGLGKDSIGNDGDLNELWEFNPSLGANGEWAWMGGSNVRNAAGAYGTEGTPGAGNAPGGRYGATNWTDQSGNFWLFGGTGYDSAGSSGYLNDLWKFNPSLGTAGEWTWIGGGNTVNQNAVYGTPESPAAGNTPGYRVYATGWTDRSGNLWLFGGAAIGLSNELWEFNPSLGTAGEWAWMNGGTGAETSIYGTLGVPAVSNVPSARFSAGSWTDAGGNLWLFGGFGYSTTQTDNNLGDLWRYQPAASTGPSTPTLDWAPGTVLTFGNALGSGDFSAVAMVGKTNVSADGAFSYYVGSVGGTAATSTTILPGGSDTLCVQWTPMSSYASQYNSTSQCLPIFVTAAPTSINWTPVSPIVSGTVLGSGQFNAGAMAGSANVSSDGTFTYYLGTVGGTVATTATILPVGDDPLCVLWTPSSIYAADYNSSQLCVNITVNASTQVADSETVTVNESDAIGAFSLPSAIAVNAPVAFFSAGTPLGFGGQAGSQQTIALFNIGQVPMTLTSAKLALGTAFSLSALQCFNGATASSLPANGFCMMTLTYTGNAPATDTDTLTFTDNAELSNLATAGSSPNYTQSITLNGAGSVTPAPAAPPATVSVSDAETVTVNESDAIGAFTLPSAIAVNAPVAFFSAGTPLGFGGQAGSQQTIAVFNIGQVPMTLTSAKLALGTAFSLSALQCFNGATASSLPANGFCMMTLTYTGNAPTTDTDTLTFADNAELSNLATAGPAPNFVQSIALTGTGGITAPPSAPPATVSVSDAETVTVTDSAPMSTSLVITTRLLPSGVVGSTYSQTLQAAGGSGAGYNWTLAKGSLPGGLALSSGGIISGAPVSAGTSTFTVQVTDSQNDTFAQTLSLTIAPALSISPASLPAGTAETTYALTLSASGGSGSGYSWSVTPQAVTSLAAIGLSFSSTGAFSGTALAGQAAFAVQVRDSQGNTATAQYQLTINKAAATVMLSDTTQTYTGSPLTVSVATTPTGLATNCTYGGSSTPPVNAGTYAVVCTVSDANYQGSVNGTFLIQNPVPLIASTSPVYVSAGGSAFTLTIAGAGFTPSSIVYWGKTQLTSKPVTGLATQLEAQVPASEIANEGTATITVQTPAPGGGTSNSWQFEISPSGNGTGVAPTITTIAGTVAAGKSASYAVKLPPGASSISVKCLNLPIGAACSYLNGTLTITTSSSTPAGTYIIVAVFTYTISGGTLSALVMLPLLLLPLALARKGWRRAGVTFAALVMLALLGVSTQGCAGGSTQSATSTGQVTLIVQ